MMIEPYLLYALAGIGLFAIGLYALFARTHLLRKILALNVMGTGVFMFLIAIAYRSKPLADPVPQAMVLTGIVVSVCATGLALALAHRVQTATGSMVLPENDESGA